MMKRIPHLFLILVLVIVALACVTPSITTPDPNFINTAIAQTQTAALGIPVTGPESPTPTMTRAASATPFPTFTVVVIGVPQLSVSVDTICRTGPGDVFARVEVLRVGEVADVVGRSADGSFWVIRNPDGTGQTCWISGQNATLTGSPGIVPVFALPPTPTPTNTRLPAFASTPTNTRTPVPTSTPSSTPTRTTTPSFTPTSTLTSSTPTTSPTNTSTPSTPTSSPTSTPTSPFTPTSTLSPTPTFSPTPTLTPSFTPTSTPSPTSTPTSTLSPGFTASFSGLESCIGTGWWVDLEFMNTGGLAFESMLVILSDTVTGTVLTFSSEDFTNRDGCSTSNTQANLSPGATQIASLPVLTYDPTGHSLRATIILCSNAGQSGTCIPQVINFTP